MIDINISLRKAYFDALTGIAGVPVFYGSLPNNISPDNYLLFRNITNSDLSTMNSSDTNTTITVEIHTFKTGNNSGLDCDQVARDVFNRILPNPGATLTVDGAQMVSTRLLSDNSQDFVMDGNRTYMSRIITFGHNIYHRSDIS